MKLGIIISVCIVVVIGVFVAFQLRGVADLPTSAATGKNLEVTTLPSGLPSFYTPANPGESAEPIYAEMIKYFNDNKRTLTSDKPPSAQVTKLRMYFLEALDNGKVGKGFLDAAVPMTLGEDAPHAAAIEVAPMLVLREVQKLHDTDPSTAVKTAIAVHAFGQRLFENNTRLINRFRGFLAMKAGIELLYGWSADLPDGEKAVNAWVDAIKKVEGPWDAKIKMIWATKPHTGNILNLAKLDKDPTMRIEAVRWLGVIKFTALGRGNARAIANLIATLKEDTDPNIAAAAAAADALTKEQFHRLR